jgi:hypothetical protein
MTLRGVNPGDIIRVDGSYAVVQHVKAGRVSFLWIKSSHSTASANGRTVGARQIEAHWKRTSK